MDTGLLAERKRIKRVQKKFKSVEFQPKLKITKEGDSLTLF